MATWNAIVEPGYDDAKQAGSVMTLEDSPIILSAGSHWAGLRFQNCPIAPGDDIDTAHLTLDVYTAARDDPAGMAIYGENSFSAAAFTTDALNITARPRTTNFVAWTGNNIGAGDKNSPDLAVVLDEIINGGVSGYLQGNDIALFIDAVADTSFHFRSYEETTTNCARLTVNYTPAATAAAGPLVNGPRLKSKLRGLV